MIYQKKLLFLFFIFISSLASGQWESDQFLFDHQNQPTRPKSKPRSETNNLKKDSMKLKTEPSGSMIESNPSIPSDSLFIHEPNENSARQLASFEKRSPITLDIKLGVMDFNSKTKMKDMSFSKQAYSFGGLLNIPLFDENRVLLFYDSTTEMKVDADTHARWESGGLQYKKEFSISNQAMEWGVLLRQFSWWKTSDIEDYSLKSITGVGISGSLSLPIRGLWHSHIEVSVLPSLTKGKGSLRGSSFEIDWVSYYQHSFARSFLINIGYERINLKSKSGTQFDLNQNILKISIGYQLSNSK